MRIRKTHAWVVSNRAFLLLLLGLAALLPGLNRLVPERQQELRVVLVAQNMARGGSWLIPEFQRTPRLKKPPLAYWAAAVPAKTYMALKGEDPPIWVYRLPGVAAGLGLLFGIWAIGRRLLEDEDQAFTAAILAASSFAFLRFGRLAETDVMQAAFLTWCVWAVTKTKGVPLSSAKIGERPLWFWALAGLFGGLAFLTKGLAAVVVPPIAIVSLWWFWRLKQPSVTRHQTLLLPRWRVGLPLAVMVFALVALPWYLYIWNHPEGQAAMLAETEALMGKNKHTGPIVYYLYTGLFLLFPASLVFGMALASVGRHAAPGEKAALSWFMGVFLLLSVLPSKQAHYTLLLLAPMVLFAATWPRLRGLISPRRVLIAVGLLFGLGLVYAHAIYPRTNPMAQVRNFVEETRTIHGNAPKVHVVGINSAIFEFHVGHVVHNIDSAAAAWQRADPGDAVLVIGKSDRVGLPNEVDSLKSKLFGGFFYSLYQKP